MSNNPNQIGNGGATAETGWEGVAEMGQPGIILGEPKKPAEIIIEDHVHGNVREQKTYDENLNEVKPEKENDREERTEYYMEHPEKFGQILGKDEKEIKDRTDWYLAKPEAEREEILSHEIEAYYANQEKKAVGEATVEAVSETGEHQANKADSPVYQIPKNEGLEVWNDPNYRNEMWQKQKEMQELRNRTIDMEKARRLQEEEGKRQEAEAKARREAEMWPEYQVTQVDLNNLTGIIDERASMGRGEVVKLQKEINEWFDQVRTSDLSKLNVAERANTVKYWRQSEALLKMAEARLANMGKHQGPEGVGDPNYVGKHSKEGLAARRAQEAAVSMAEDEPATENDSVAENDPVAEKSKDAEKSDEKTSEKPAEKKEKTAEKAEKPVEKVELSREQMLEAGKNLIPGYSAKKWEKVCKIFSDEELRGTYDILEALANGDTEGAYKAIMEKWSDSGLVMGMVVVLSPDGAGVVNRVYNEVWDGANEKNRAFIEKKNAVHTENKGAEEMEAIRESRVNAGLVGRRVESAEAPAESGAGVAETELSETGEKLSSSKNKFIVEAWENDYNRLREQAKDSPEDIKWLDEQFGLADRFIASFEEDPENAAGYLSEMMQDKNSLALSMLMKYSPDAVRAVERLAFEMSDEELPRALRNKNGTRKSRGYYSKLIATFEEGEVAYNRGAEGVDDAQEGVGDSEEGSKNDSKEDVKAEKKMAIDGIDLSDVEWNERGTAAAKEMNSVARAALLTIRKERVRAAEIAKKHGVGIVDMLAPDEDKILDILSNKPEGGSEEDWKEYEANAVAVIRDIYNKLGSRVKDNREMNAAAGGYMDEYNAEMNAAREKMRAERKANEEAIARAGIEEADKKRPKVEEKPFRAEWEDMEHSDSYFIAGRDQERNASKGFDDVNKMLAYEEKKISEMPEKTRKQRKAKQLAFENLRLATDVMNMPINDIEIPEGILKNLVRSKKYIEAAGYIRRFSKVVPEAEEAVTGWYRKNGYLGRRAA